MYAIAIIHNSIIVNGVDGAEDATILKRDPVIGIIRDDIFIYLTVT
jgi:hypothetical protein